MTLAEINWLDISINLLLVVFVIVCLLMTLIILMQRPKQEGLGAAFGGGVTDQVFGARTTNVLQRGTVYLGSMFFVIALVLAILIGHQNKHTKLGEDEKPAVEVEPVGLDPVEVLPVDLQPKSLIDELPEGVSEETETEAPPVDAPTSDDTTEGSGEPQQ